MTELNNHPAEHPPQDFSLEALGDAEALARLRPRLLAIPAGQVRQFRAAVPAAVGNALEVQRSFRGDRDRVVAAISPGEFDPADVDDLAERADALWQADTALQLATRPRSELAETVVEAREVRQGLTRVASYLFGQDEEIAPKLDEIRGGNGYLDLAADLQTLSRLLQDNWVTVRRETSLGVSALEEARELALRLVEQTGPRRTQSELAELRDLRDRAGSYLGQGVEDIRAVMSFLNRHQSVPLAGYPSLYASRARTPRSRSTPEGDGPPSEGPSRLGEAA